MTQKEKLALLEEIMELDEGTLKPEMLLADIEEYDSMTVLSIIVMMDDEFGVKLDSKTVKTFQSVNDILARMVKE
ncbi:MAG: acyl carrier protein [Synergistaceae bacterium]|nr:acyl carrier protein [Synergistaceae bacterium]